MPGDPQDLQDLKEHAVGITAALYRVTGLWHDGEPLRTDMRTKAREIFEMILEGKYDGANARVMIGYLEVGKRAAGVNPINFEVLAREYKNMFERAARASPVPRAESQDREIDAGSPLLSEILDNPGPTHAYDLGQKDKDERMRAELNDRQIAILARLGESGTARISDFFQTFGDVSSKTIQRDLQDLVLRNLIRKTGDKRWTTYMLTESQNVRYMSHVA